MQQDSFDDLPKLVRYAPQKPMKKIQLIKPLEISSNDLPSPARKISDAVMRKSEASEILTPTSQNRQTKKILISDQDLKRTQRNIKVERRQDRTNQLNQPIPPQKNIDRSKALVTQMVNKISAKNIAQELLPISNETINKKITQIQIQKAELIEKATGYQLQLSSNPHNKNIQKQLEILEKAIERFDTMKLLYLDKIELRSQNRRLLNIIEDLKNQNKQIKAKIAQGLQQIQAHSQSLPCDKEKTLAIEIKKCQEELKSQREMRINLEKNISNTIQNFTRLYEQADLARKIVVGQLKEIQAAKLKLKIQQEENNSDNQSQREGLKSDESKPNDSKGRKGDDPKEKTLQKNQKPPSSRFVNERNPTLKKPNEKQSHQSDEVIKHARKSERQISDPAQKSSNSQKQGAFTQKRSLQQMVRKMRGNQLAFIQRL